MSADEGVRPDGPRPEHPPFWPAVKADLREMAKVKGVPYPSVGGLVDVMTLPGTWSVLIWRLANELHRRKLRPLSRLLYILNIVVLGAELQPGAFVGPGCVIPHPVGIGIASGTVIGERARFMRFVSIGGSGNPKKPGHPTIGDDVWVFDSAKILGPVHVGDRSILGAAAVIAGDIPPDMFVFGTRRADTMRPLADLGLEDHGGSLPARVAEAEAGLVGDQEDGTGDDLVVEPREPTIRLVSESA